MANVTVGSRKEIVAIAEKDLAFFALYYLEDHVRGEIGKLHDEWSKVLMDKYNVAIAAPRGHCKTTWFSLIYVLWCILFKKKKFILLLSDSFPQAKELLGSVVKELETNDRILEDFGRIAGYAHEDVHERTVWTAGDIVTLTGVKVMARGWSSKLRGMKYGAHRPDLIILDDVENDENVNSEEQRKKLRDTFYNSILNLGTFDTQVFVVGTILHFDSLLNNLLMNPPDGWQTRMYRAFKEDGTPLWDEVWTKEKLEIKRNQIGSQSFEQEYMNNPLRSDQSILNPCFFYTEDLDFGHTDFYGYLDPAMSEKTTADWTAFVTIGRNRDSGKLYVVEPMRFRGNPTKIMDFLFAQYTKYRHKMIGIEAVLFQRVLAKMILNESAKRGIYVPIIEREIDKDKVRRALDISVYLENGTILFKESERDFLNELKQFPLSSHDDFVDAFVGAAKLCLQGGGSGLISSGRLIYPKQY